MKPEIGDGYVPAGCGKRFLDIGITRRTAFLGTVELLDRFLDLLFGSYEKTDVCKLSYVLRTLRSDLDRMIKTLQPQGIWSAH